MFASPDHQDQNEENESSELRKMGGHLESHLQYLGPDGKYPHNQELWGKA